MSATARPPTGGAPIPVYLNGRFLLQRRTGVQRSAGEWLHALDSLLADGAARPDEAWWLLHPPGAEVPALRHLRARPIGPAGLPGHLWEQWSLPRAARDGLLVSLAGAAPWFAARQVVTFHDAAVFDQPSAYTLAFRLWYRALFRHLARRADRVLTVSEFSRGRLLARLPLAPARAAVLPNGADHLQRVAPDAGVLGRLGLSPGGYLLAVASANPSKNLTRLARAMTWLPPTLRRPLVLVGGRHAGVFGDAGAHLHETVLRAGALRDAELVALYRHAALFVMPSLYEGFGLPAVEAMACGCPVVAARRAALPEVCGDAVEWVDPRDPQDIARGMARVLRDPARAAELTRAGHTQADRWRWADAAARLLDMLRNVNEAAGAVGGRA